MMSTVIVTGAGRLTSPESVKRFARESFRGTGIGHNRRRWFFGLETFTLANRQSVENLSPQPGKETVLIIRRRNHLTIRRRTTRPAICRQLNWKSGVNQIVTAVFE
jgi:hypothetical protein